MFWIGWLVLGIPGLVFGFVAGVIARGWGRVVFLAVTAAFAAYYGMRHVPSSGDDDPKALLSALAIAASGGGCVIGLMLGAWAAHGERIRPRTTGQT